MSYKIKNISMLPVWNALGHLSLEFQVELQSKHTGISIAQSGISTGSKEQIFNSSIFTNNFLDLHIFLDKWYESYEDFDFFIEHAFFDQPKILPTLKSALSIAFAKAAASACGQPLWMHLSKSSEIKDKFPIPFFCALSGGIHGNFAIDFQDIIIVPQSVTSFKETLEKTSLVFQKLKEVLLENGQWGGYGIKGAYRPYVKNLEESFDSVMMSIEKAGYSPAIDFAIGIDVAATTLWKQECYYFPHIRKSLTTNKLIQLLVRLVKNYPISFLEDPLRDDDLEGLQQLRIQLPNSTFVIGDDITASKSDYIIAAYSASACNGFIIKPSQAGTLSEVKKAYNTIKALNSFSILSGRSGDNELADLMDIAWAWGFPYMKIGGFSGAEIMAKYNQGLRIERDMERFKES